MTEAPPKPATPFAAQVREPLNPEQLKTLERIKWEERFFSLWAPVTIFGVVFSIYIAIVESSVCTYLWLQLPLKVFGLLCLAYWLVLVALGQLVRPFKAMRKARREAEELYDEVEEVMKKRGASLEKKARGDVTELTQALLAALAQRDAKALSDAVAKLDAAADKHLMKWRKGGALDFAKGFGKALLVALAIRTLLIEPYKIPSGSMVPTLEIGDQIFVNKFIYGVRIPFTHYVPFQIVRPPRRGDVIVFNNPVNTEKDFIKRVIGVPGDKIEVHGHQLIVNGVEQPWTIEAQDYHWWDDPNARGEWLERDDPDLGREALDGQPHYTLRGKIASPFDDNPIVVPEKTVFVMGDNRDHSADSRYNLGEQPPNKVVFVPYGNIKGKAMVIWLSLSHGGFLSGFFGGTGLRTDRLFQEVTLCGSEAPRDAHFAR